MFYVEKEEVNFICSSGYTPRPETLSIVCGEDGWNVSPTCVPGKNSVLLSLSSLIFDS